MGRGAAVVYPKDAAQIIALADIFPGARVLEASAGSGALSCWLLRSVGEDGLLVSFERRADFADIARANVERFFGGPHPAWQLRVGDLMEVTGALADDAGRAGRRRPAGRGSPERRPPTPIRPIRPARPGPAPGRTTPGLRIVSTGWYWTCWRHGSSHTWRPTHSSPAGCCAATSRPLPSCPGPWRPSGNSPALTSRPHGSRWSAAGTLTGLAVRPEHRMVGHTGFLITARRLAQGITAPPRRRRPAKGSREESDQ